MLKLSKLTDYAFLILSEMAKAPKQILSASSLADTLHLSLPTVSKILKILTEAQLLSSVRGAEGGYKLAREPAKITIADIIASMEGQLAMTECCETLSHCGIHSVCTMRENWQVINQMVHSLLAGFNILDMLKPLKLEKNHGK